MSDGKFALALHGGAGPLVGRNYDRELAHMRELIELGRDRLALGGPALDVVVEIVNELEASGLYVAGRGASPNTAGLYELDACVMDGRDSRAGAVAALVGFQSPIAIARKVMELTPHVLLVGQGAAAFAGDLKQARIDNPAEWFTHAGGGGAGTASGDLATGTVGCVAFDRDGGLAAATSTGGVFGKLPGRVGDCPIPGSGTWADRTVAVSCTGAGEMFIRVAAAAQVANRMRFGGEKLEAACAAALAEVRALKGEGGLIAIDAAGEIAMPFNSAGMKRAALHPDGRVSIQVFA